MKGIERKLLLVLMAKNEGGRGGREEGRKGGEGRNDVPMTKRSRTKAPARAVAVMGALRVFLCVVWWGYKGTGGGGRMR